MKRNNARRDETPDTDEEQAHISTTTKVKTLHRDADCKALIGTETRPVDLSKRPPAHRSWCSICGPAQQANDPPNGPTDSCDRCGELMFSGLLTDGICIGCLDGDGPDPRLVTDGGVLTVGDLDCDPTTTVWITGRNGPGRQTAHTEESCWHLQRGKSVREETVADISDGWPVCRHCEGVATTGTAEGVDPKATRRALADTSPEELGLSPVGERHDERDLRSDGGVDVDPEEVLPDTTEPLGGEADV